MAKEPITLADVLQLLRLEELPARQLFTGDVACLPRIGLVAVLEVLLSPKTVTVVVDDVDRWLSAHNPTVARKCCPLL